MNIFENREFDYIKDLNVSNAKQLQELIEENIELKEDIACLKLELEYYRNKERASII